MRPIISRKKVLSKKSLKSYWSSKKSDILSEVGLNNWNFSSSLLLMKAKFQTIRLATKTRNPSTTHKMTKNRWAKIFHRTKNQLLERRPKYKNKCKTTSKKGQKKKSKRKYQLFFHQNPNRNHQHKHKSVTEKLFKFQSKKNQTKIKKILQTRNQKM